MIVGADLHYMEKAPSCRDPEEYEEAVYTKSRFIQTLCNELDIPYAVAGDIFDHWKSSPELINRVISFMPEKVILIAGQHDLENHSLDSFKRTALQSLVLGCGAHLPFPSLKRLAGLSRRSYKPDFKVCGLSFNMLPPDMGEDEWGLVLWHRLVRDHGMELWKDNKALLVTKLMDKFPKTKLIVTGDNHKQFGMEEIDDSGNRRFLINPGSMMRISVDQKQFRPSVYGYSFTTQKIHRIELPFKEDAVLEPKEHLDKDTREKQMEAYVKSASKHVDTKLSFSHNLRTYIKRREISKNVTRLVWEACQ